MVIQYPHVLTATVMAPATRDDAGNYVPGAATNLDATCRAEPNSGGRYVVVADGTQVFFSWMVYLPKGSPAIPEGSHVVITQDGNSIGSGKVLRFSAGQLNCRIWL